MSVDRFLFFASFFVSSIFDFSLGQNGMTSLGAKTAGNDGKVRFDLDDLIIEIQPPPGRKSILSARVPNGRNWENFDNKNFEDLPQVSEHRKQRNRKARRKRQAISGDDWKLREKLFGNPERVTMMDKFCGRGRRSLPLLEDYGEATKPASKQNHSFHRQRKSIEFMDISSDSVKDCTELQSDWKQEENLENNLIQPDRPKENLMAKTSALPDLVQTYVRSGYNLAVGLHDRFSSLTSKTFCPISQMISMLNSIHKQAQEFVSRYAKLELMLSRRKLYRQHYDPLRCDLHAKYRSLDGSCNNIVHSSWGQTNTAYGRILPARYSDGVHAMPISVTNEKLPNPRDLSLKLMTRGARYDEEFSLAMMQWGQVLAHDLASQVIDRTSQGAIECCSNDGKMHLDESLQHKSCAPISISRMDKFYSVYGQRCMNFVRTITVPAENKHSGSADQLNAVTSFLDCSQVYGVSKTESDELREFIGGRLKVEFRNGRWMLPTTKNHSDACDIWSSEDFCHKSGDYRTCQNPQLVILQTILVREHNRVAGILSLLNPHWKDEKIFQEARRIVIAEYQHITYNEWLPLLLGHENTTKDEFLTTENKLSKNYNENVDPSISIGFATAAFRSLHSMIAGHIGVYNDNRDLINVLRLDTHYYRSKVIEKDDNFAGLLRGLITQFAEMQDTNLNSQVTEYLLRSRKTFGKDLIALDIQRGRDHGVPSYNDYRKICDLRPAENFDDLSREISEKNIEKLRQEYAHVDDVDLIVGIYMENPSGGSRLGPTNRCIIAEQFYRSRIGDRYFYDNDDFPHSFTAEQFGEIKKATLARLICDTENSIGIIQRRAFSSMSWKNCLVSCENLPKMDLSPWME